MLCAALLWKNRPPSAAPLAAAGDEFQVNTQTDGIQQSAAVALAAGGGFVVAWQSEVRGLGDEIRAQRFGREGAALGEEIAVNTVAAANQNAPAIAMTALGDFVVVWQSLVAHNFEIRARRFAASGAAQGGEIDVTETTGDAHGAPRVAMDAEGNFVVVWESSLHGSYEIRARRFAADGGPRGDEIAVNAQTASSQRIPAVAMDKSGRFVVVWRSNVDGRFETRARRFTAAGVPQGDEFAVQPSLRGDQLVPAVAMDADGDFVVAWESSLDGANTIRARRFSAQGNPQGDDFAVAWQPANVGDPFAPAVAMAADGGFAVAWHTRAAGDMEVRARAFTAGGTAQSPELAVDTRTTGIQKSAAVAMNLHGDTVVAWHSDTTGSWEIAARRYQRR